MASVDHCAPIGHVSDQRKSKSNLDPLLIRLKNAIKMRFGTSCEFQFKDRLAEQRFFTLVNKMVSTGRDEPYLEAILCLFSSEHVI